MVVSENKDTQRNLTLQTGKVIRRFDTVLVATSQGMQTMEIPCLPRTIYWAVLRFMYLNHSRKVSTTELVNGVNDLMMEVDEVYWNRYKSKTKVKTKKNGVIIEKEARSWQERIITNGRNLVRIGGGVAYGKRFLVRGQVMRYGTENSGEAYFIMYLNATTENTKELKRGKKRKAQDEPANLVQC